ncbi:hypothetical protein, partial [Candidatus Aeolococcus gillhamiae]|uniref:hypothetical protein n=1 Tax=Candidatus Aeolococcus gillhamiae TaxID=3127015 RepID=UPI003077CAC3
AGTGTSSRRALGRAHAAAPARPPAAPPATPILRTGSVAAAGFAVDQRQANQSLLQSVQACISGGIAVDTSHAGCNAAFGP